MQPQRLGDRLLRAEARGEMLRRAAAAGSVGALAVGEQAFGQPRVAFERALEPVDLQEVQADPGGCHWREPRGALGPYSTVTVFARLRGWSTLSPRSRAMS